MRTVKICANAVLLKHIKVYLLAIRSLVLKSLENQQYDCLWVGAYLVSIHPLSPCVDQPETSPYMYIIHTLSSKQVMRILKHIR